MELATHQAPPVDGPGLLLGFGFGLGLGLGFGFGFGLGLGLGFGLGFMYGAGFVIGCVVDGGGGLSIVGSGYVVPGVVGLMMGTSSWSEYMEGEIAMSSSWNASFLLFLMAFVGCLSAMLVPEKIKRQKRKQQEILIATCSIDFQLLLFSMREFVSDENNCSFLKEEKR